MVNNVYGHETTGSLMTTDYVAISDTSNIEEAVQYLRDNVQGKKHIHYIYMVNEAEKLSGVLSIRELLLSTNDNLIKDIMKKNIISLPLDLDQEEAAKVFRDKDLVAIPVVNDEGYIEGVIHVDDIIDIIHQEADEDIGMITASGKEIDFHTQPLKAAGRRLPWLVILLFVGLVSGGIIARFEETLEQVVALAFFMPMIAGMTGNTGTQSLAVVVRGLVSEKLDFKNTSKLLVRELFVGIFIGVSCAIIVWLIAYVWIGSITLSFVVSFSLLCTLIIGTLAGTIIPLILYKLKADPAIASGPLITTINDILSLLIYFGIATFFLNNLL